MKFFKQLACVILIHAFSTVVFSQESVPNEVIVRYKDGVSMLRSLSSGGLIRTMKDMPEYISDNTYLIRTDRPADEIIEELKDDANIEFVQPNYIYKALITIPNDEVFSDNSSNYQYDKDVGINAYNGWDIQKDASDILVGVLDSGISIYHKDLSLNIENNGIDTTSVVVSGRDAGMDDNGHGTHVAGIIGAVCNNGIGSCGVAWRVRLMPLKVLGSNGIGTSSGIIKAIDYAISKNVDIINASLGGEVNQFAYFEYEAIKRATDKGIVVVAAAGNAEQGKEPYNTDIYPAFPAGYGTRGVISVGASNNSASLAPFSYYGSTTVHLFAPGYKIYSTYLNNEYRKESGTSMATPFVTGVVSLMLAKDRSLTPTQVEMILINSVNIDNSSNLRGRAMASGIINLEKALKFDKSKLFEPPHSLKLSKSETEPNVINISWEDGDGETEIYSRVNKGSFQHIATLPRGVRSYSDKLVINGSHQYMYYRVRSLKNGVYSPFLRKDINTNGKIEMNTEFIVAGEPPIIKTRITESGTGGCSISNSTDNVMILILIALIVKSTTTLRTRLRQNI